MPTSSADAITLDVEGGERVSGLVQVPQGASAACVLAHGAGAGMTHPSMAALAEGLAARHVASLRYQFPYMEHGSKRPDAPKLAHATVRAAVAAADRLLPGLALFAGGRSFGARMTSQAQAIEPLPKVLGLVFFAFPLHPAGKPSDERARHLDAVELPMLFLQGTQDKLAEPQWLQPVVDRLGARATLLLVPDADHSFHVPARSGRKDAQVRDELLDRFVAWSDGVRSPAAA